MQISFVSSLFLIAEFATIPTFPLPRHFRTKLNEFPITIIDLPNDCSAANLLDMTFYFTIISKYNIFTRDNSFTRDNDSSFSFPQILYIFLSFSVIVTCSNSALLNFFGIDLSVVTKVLNFLHFVRPLIFCFASSLIPSLFGWCSAVSFMRSERVSSRAALVGTTFLKKQLTISWSDFDREINETTSIWW